ncbi:hypothetical protein DPMN_053855 [Dreissena polymorpha]|uniref:Uncharacterized protein n=1 Tax=Dreissena polymorpha TaxID=45954 RepID=A0A9D4CM64_DREPO|nr:hypothetical protein DPMN_053855 [Dreissena polymorpha]
MKDFTDLTYITSPQHKKSTKALINIVASDLENMQAQITTCSPYTADYTLRKIVKWLGQVWTFMHLRRLGTISEGVSYVSRIGL